MKVASRRWLVGGGSIVCLTLGALLLALCLSAEAQQPAKFPRIGFLGVNSPSAISARIDAFRQGLRALGYEEGKNILIEYRWAQGNFNRLPDLAGELVLLNVDVIVTVGPADTRAAKKATSNIPIVMGYDNDPVGSGFVATLARPGRNITGLSTLSPELSGKRLELLKEVLPRLSRVAVFGSSVQPGNAQSLRETELAATAFGVQLQSLDLRVASDVEPAFRAARDGRANAAIVLSNPLATRQRIQIAELARKSRLPAIYPQSDYMDADGLMFYGPSLTDLFRRAATYVDKILKGAMAGDLPVEQPTKFDLAINLKTAKQIGLTIPPNVLARADRVIR